MDIILVKVMDATKEIVLRNKLYYTDNGPDEVKLKGISTVFLIGERKKGNIPLIGTCDFSIDSCSDVHPEFTGKAKAKDGWKYEWTLSNLVRYDDIPDIRTYITSAADKKAVTTLQTIGYIDSNNILSSSGILVGKNRVTNNVKNNDNLNNQEPAPAPKEEEVIPFNNVYSEGETVHIKTKKFGPVSTGEIKEVENVTKGDIIIDQYITIHVDGKDIEYSASALRKLECDLNKK